MQDNAQNSDSNGQDAHAQRQRIQFEITIADSDLKKKETEIEAEKMNLKRLMRELAVLQTKISEKKQEIIRIENDKMKIDNDIKALKKKLNGIV
ncbi:MAG: hypothetical protein V1804_01375 [Patescibacteria group bacterium]